MTCPTSGVNLGSREDDGRRGLHDQGAQTAAVRTSRTLSTPHIMTVIHTPFQFRKSLEKNAYLHLQVLQQVPHNFILYQPLRLCTSQGLVSLLEKDGYVPANEPSLCILTIPKLA
jgi:hypothetical protein